MLDFYDFSTSKVISMFPALPEEKQFVLSALHSSPTDIVFIFIDSMSSNFVKTCKKNSWKAWTIFHLFPQRNFDLILTRLIWQVFMNCRLLPLNLLKKYNFKFSQFKSTSNDLTSNGFTEKKSSIFLNFVLISQLRVLRA